MARSTSRRRESAVRRVFKTKRHPKRQPAVAARRAEKASSSRPGKKRTALTPPELRFLREAIEELESNHVLYEVPAGLDFERCLTTNRTLKSIVRKRFHTVIFVDAREGIPKERFSTKRFYRYLLERLGSALGVPPVVSRSHLHDISEFARDLEPSLFCFLNGHLFPDRVLRTLRDFTQANHSVIFVTEDAKRLRV